MSFGIICFEITDQIFNERYCYTLVLNAGCFDSAVRLRAGSLCGVLIMLIRHALHAFEKYGRDS